MLWLITASTAMNALHLQLMSLAEQESILGGAGSNVPAQGAYNSQNGINQAILSGGLAGVGYDSEIPGQLTGYELLLKNGKSVIWGTIG